MKSTIKIIIKTVWGRFLRKIFKPSWAELEFRFNSLFNGEIREDFRQCSDKIVFGI